MHCEAIFAVLAFSTAVLGAVAPPPYQISSTVDAISSTDSLCTQITTTTTKTKYRKKTSTTTTTETQNITIFPPCPSTTCRKPTVTTTVTSIDTTTVTAAAATITATPGPVVELTAYAERLCAVEPVASNGNAPDFEDIHLTYNSATSSSQCAKIGGNTGSFSWDVIAFADVSSSCHLYFYFGDSCFDDNGGSTQFSLSNGQGACHNLRGVRSVRLFC